MAKNAVLTLSPAGALNTPAEKADALMAHAEASDKSQTALYGSNVTSLAWLFERYSKDIGELCRNIQSAYLDLFSRHFDNVDVDVAVDPNQDVSANQVKLLMYISFSQDGKSYTVGNELYGMNGRFAKTLQIKQYGVTSN